MTPPRELSWPPHVLASLAPDSNVDRLGRRQPRRLTVVGMLRALPQPEGGSKEVPGSYWTLDVNEDGFSEAVVSCPCGHEPHVELGGVSNCECERVYLFTGTELRVFNSPRDTPKSLGTADPAQTPEPPASDAP